MVSIIQEVFTVIVSYGAQLALEKVLIEVLASFHSCYSYVNFLLLLYQMNLISLRYWCHWNSFTHMNDF